MKVIDLKNPHKEYPIVDCGLVLGNFDGVHRGHRALIDELKKLKDLLDSGIITQEEFDVKKKELLGF